MDVGKQTTTRKKSPTPLKHTDRCGCRCDGRDPNAGDEDDLGLSTLVWRDPQEEVQPSSANFFWRPHTVSVLVALLLMLFYVTCVEDFVERKDGGVYDAKRGIFACCAVFIAFGVTQARDGPIIRPHPVFWRFILCLGIIYELWLIFLLFQTRDHARVWMSYLDPSLGQVLPEQDYGGNCLIYDSSTPDNPWHNVKEKMDGFVFAHLLGWWAKTLILRDYWVSLVLSASFELLEYTLEHQLANFSECWWDHWIMDFVLCNGIGIYFGMLTLQYLEVKTYKWSDLISIPTYSGKLKRFIQQFTPMSWRKFNWGTTRSLKRWLFVLALMVMFSFAELNVFYLKAALWIPPKHPLITFRLVLFFLMGLVGVRESYDFLTDSKCRKFGQQAWLLCAIITTEIFICVKFMREVVSTPPPQHIVFMWGCGGVGVLLYTCWLFLPGVLGFRERTLSENIALKNE